MIYKTKDKTTIHVRLSQLLYNGCDVMSAKLGMSMSEIVRMAIYNYLKENFNKTELNILSDRDDLVDEWVAWLSRKRGRGGGIPVGGEKQYLIDLIRKGEIEYIADEDDLDDDFTAKLKEIKKKHIIPSAEKFLRENFLTEKEALELFTNYREKLEKASNEALQKMSKALDEQEKKNVKKKKKS
jgi:hypothetical protein